MQVYLTRNPDGYRIAAQDRPFARWDFPPGPQGDNWPMRHLTVADDEWAAMTRATVPPDEQDAVHVKWWRAAPEG